MEIKQENKVTIEKYYQTVLKRNESLTAKQIDTVYSLDTMSSHEIAGHIEMANYFEQLYTEQMGIDSIRQQVVVNLDKVTAAQATEIRVLKRKLESKTWWLKTVSAICGAAIVGIFIK